MAKSIINVNTKRRGRPATGQGTLIGVRLQPDQLAALDAWIARQKDVGLTRPEAVRRILAKAVSGRPAEKQ